MEYKTGFISSASFWVPEYLPVSAWVSHGPFAFWLTEQLRPRCFVELGTHHGYSFFSVCQAVKRLELGTVAYAVDTWRGDEHAGHYGDDVFAAVSAHAAGYTGFATLMRSTFDEALSYFSDGSIDLLHIDGRHHYDDVKHDFESWLPKLTDDAIVLLHDTNVREREFGVWRFFSELSARHPSFQFVHGHGLGIVCPGSSIPDPLQDLLQAGRDAVHATRRTYSSLGHAVAQRQRLSLSQQALTELGRLDVNLSPDGLANLNAASGHEQTVELIGTRLADMQSKASALRLRLATDDVARQDLEARLAEAQAVYRHEVASRADIESRLAVVQTAHLHEVALKADAEIRLAMASVEEGRAWTQFGQTSIIGDLLRRVIRGRDSKLMRLQAELDWMKVADRRLHGELRNLRALVAGRAAGSAQPAGMVHSSAGERYRTRSLERQLDSERVHRTAVEERLTTIERSRAWRAYLRLRSAFGLQILPARKNPVNEADVDCASIITAINATGLFDGDYYRENNPDVDAFGIDPTEHFASIGWREGRNPNTWFDTISYIENNPDVAALGNNPLLHYANYGREEGRLPVGPRQAVLATGLFDAAFYLDTYPDIAQTQTDPATHFATEGWREGRNPNSFFNTEFYISQNPDVEAAEINPLIHYALIGAAEGRSPLPPAHLVTTIPHGDEALSCDDARLAQEVQDSGIFDEDFYRANNPDVAALGISLALHFAHHGWREGRKPHPDFDPALYLALHSDVAAEGVNPLLHFARSGGVEGRLVSSTGERKMPPVATVPEKPEALTVQAPTLDRTSPSPAPDFAYKPTISIITPVYNIAPALLRKAVASVQAQTYPHWEMCLCDDGSSSQDTIQALNVLSESDLRLRAVWHTTNQGISTATNTALSLAQGEFVAFLDNDDELVPEALEQCVHQLNLNRELDILYSDEDKLNQRGDTEEPFFKPDWSPSLLREVMYVGHLLIIRRSLVEKIGGLDKAFEGVQDFELALRASEHTDRIFHIRKILYHWRRIPGSIADDITAKPKLGERQVAAVNAHLRRIGLAATAHAHPVLQHRAVLVPEPRKTHPRVSIIILTKDQPKLIGGCLDSIFEKTSYPNIEVVVVDNGTTDREALQAIGMHPVVHVPFVEPFNYSRGNNVGVQASSGELLLFLNNDTEVIDADWLEQMLFLLDDPSVAAVGPMLLYPDGTVQHAGVALGMRGTADHVLRGLPNDADGYFGSLTCTREVSAVTFACAMVRRIDYDEVGGLSEFYATHYQDVDICLRLRLSGKRILYTPRTRLLHHESATRGPRYDAIDRALLIDSWGDVIGAGDPYARWEPEARGGVHAS